MILYSKLILG